MCNLIQANLITSPSLQERLERIHGIRDIHLAVALILTLVVPWSDAEVELLLERVCFAAAAAVDFDAVAAVVGVEEFVDGGVAVLRDRRELQRLLLLLIAWDVTIAAIDNVHRYAAASRWRCRQAELVRCCRRIQHALLLLDLEHGNLLLLLLPLLLSRELLLLHDLLVLP